MVNCEPASVANFGLTCLPSPMTAQGFSATLRCGGSNVLKVQDTSLAQDRKHTHSIAQGPRPTMPECKTATSNTASSNARSNPSGNLSLKHKRAAGFILLATACYVTRLLHHQPEPPSLLEKSQTRMRAAVRFSWRGAALWAVKQKAVTKVNGSEGTCRPHWKLHCTTSARHVQVIGAFRIRARRTT